MEKNQTAYSQSRPPIGSVTMRFFADTRAGKWQKNKTRQAS
jgi:hypothetical protein